MFRRRIRYPDRLAHAGYLAQLSGVHLVERNSFQRGGYLCWFDVNVGGDINEDEEERDLESVIRVHKAMHF